MSDMTNWYEILAGFLERYGAPVEGRAHEALPEEIREQLRRMASGGLREDDRARLALLLRDHPAWVGCLAQEIKALRPPSAPAPQSTA